MAAAEGNFDFQEIASFLPVPLFYFSANQQTEYFPSMNRETITKQKKKEKEKNHRSATFPSNHAITADSASTARRKAHFAAR